MACLLPIPTHSPKVKVKHSMYKIVPCAAGTPTVVGTKCDMGPFVTEWLLFRVTITTILLTCSQTPSHLNDFFFLHIYCLEGWSMTSLIWYDKHKSSHLKPNYPGFL